VRAGIFNARKACSANTYVALDIGSVGELLAPYGELEEEEAFAIIFRDH
jgi:hypothetical protein